MATEAKHTFDVNGERATYFLQIHEAVQPGVGAPAGPVRELPRASVVFAVGALDAYLSELSAEVLVSQLVGAGAPSDAREVLRRVQSEIPTLALEVALIADPQERIDKMQSAIVDYFHNRVSHHGAKGVSAALQRMGGRPADLWSALEDLGWGNPQASLESWTGMRHEIVHQGRSPRVRRKQAYECIGLVTNIVETVDEQAEELVP